MFLDKYVQKVDGALGVMMNSFIFFSNPTGSDHTIHTLPSILRYMCT